MNRKAQKLVMRLSAISSLILGIILSIAVICFALSLTFGLTGFNLSKIILVDLVLAIIALVIFLVFFGLFEFFTNYIGVEEEIEHLEQEVRELEGNKPA